MTILSPRAKREIVETVHACSRALLGRHRVTLYRWVRARADLARLNRANIAFVSCAKAGRTWIRVMISRLYQVKYGLPATAIIERDNLYRMNPAIPIFLFTMGNYIADIYPVGSTPSPYDGKKLIFLARHPADNAVSAHFHVQNRVPAAYHDIKRLPVNAMGRDLLSHLQDPDSGLANVMNYMNRWAGVLRKHKRHLLLRYEDIRAEPLAELQRIASFLDESFAEEHYKEAVEFASLQNLRAMEEKDFFSNSRLQARDPSNPSSYKVRRGKVGGYRDYLTSEQIAWVDEEIAKKLDPLFGYARVSSQI